MEAPRKGFSSRTGWPAHPNPISRLLDNKRRQKIPILDLSESNPTRCAFRHFGKVDLSALSDPLNLSYDPDPQGLLEARQAVCAYYAEKGIALAPEQIVLTSGTSEAYGFLFRLLTDPGDEILAAEPSYPLFETLGDLNDLHLKKFRGVYRGGWRLDMDSLGRGFGPRTKALLLVHPNNPTGHFITAEERRCLNAACARHGSAMIVDEVFLDSAWALNGAPVSFAGQEEVLSFVLSGVSKVLGLPQMKLSWIVVSGPQTLRAEALRRLELVADAYLSVNTPSQRALPVWMRQRRASLDELNGRVSGNFHHLEESLKEVPGHELLKSEGGWYAVLKGPSSMSDEAFVMTLLRDKDLLLHPGFFFDFPEDNYLVLSLLPDEAVFRKGIRRLCEAMGEGPIVK